MELLADRKYREKEQPDRCWALGLRINIGRRARCEEQLCRFTGGGGKGKYVYTVAELTSADKQHRDDGDYPAWMKEQPGLKALLAKNAHFFNDYMHDEFPALKMDVSDGRHKELSPADVQNLEDRLLPIQTTQGIGEFAVFNRAELYIKNIPGVQSICSSTLETYYGYNRMVSALRVRV